MYAVVEFKQKECTVILLMWLDSEKKKCYWPPVKNEQQLKLNLIHGIIPENNWKMYDIEKIHYTAGISKLLTFNINVVAIFL